MGNFSNEIEWLNNFLQTSSIFYQRNIDLKKKTWIQRGGIANFYITPENVKELQSICSFLYKNNIFFEIVGATSNLYFHNSYNPDIVISTVQVKEIEETEEYIICACGVNVASLSKRMIKEGVKGFEGLIDLPGTIGASVYNNSSCYNCSIAAMLVKVELLQENNEIVFLSSENLGYTYRSSSLKRKEQRGTILRVYLKKEYDSPQKLMNIVNENHRIREMTQEGRFSRNLGSCYIHVQTDGFVLFCLRIIYFIYKIIATLFKVNTMKQKQMKMKIYFSLLGYNSLIPYISYKSFNCFIWKDIKADEAFLKYQKWMKKVYRTDSLEIEIKNGNN